MGIDWVTFEGKRMQYRSKTRAEHYRLVIGAMRAKLEQNPKVREILLKTGDLILMPDHIEDPRSIGRVAVLQHLDGNPK
jgi:predicted NAD-dependent protein-ADP-ribosyltransferase YbiA (DUF1768 family)